MSLEFPLKLSFLGAREIAQWLRVFPDLPEGQGLVLAIMGKLTTTLTPAPGESLSSSKLCGHHTCHLVHTHMNVEKNIRTHKIKFKS